MEVARRTSTDTRFQVLFENMHFYWEKWCAQGDDFRTFLGEFVASLPQVEFPHRLSL